MAHPTRLRILEILSKGEACVCHLTAILGQRQPYVSQQLMTLREAGLVNDRKDGIMVYYSLSDGRMQAVIQATRNMLLANHPGLRFPELPDPPVEGCPCPKCEALGGCR
ncbi:MAG: winged helix-turn-helix transcriptional regulator [Anaerolineae bacterium]|nr:winged helix-turn-helix transcriptional regulator [Anaerolineae bacterium]